MLMLWDRLVTQGLRAGLEKKAQGALLVLLVEQAPQECLGTLDLQGHSQISNHSLNIFSNLKVAKRAPLLIHFHTCKLKSVLLDLVGPPVIYTASTVAFMSLTNIYNCSQECKDHLDLRVSKVQWENLEMLDHRDPLVHQDLEVGTTRQFVVTETIKGNTDNTFFSKRIAWTLWKRWGYWQRWRVWSHGTIRSSGKTWFAWHAWSSRA